MNNILGLILLMATLSVKSQFQEGFTFEGKTELVTYNQLKPTIVHGAELNYFVTENLSLDYSFSSGENYTHMPLSIPITAFLYATQSSENEEELENEQDAIEEDTPESSSRWGYLFALLIPEGVSGHISLGKKTYLSPSIKPLSFDLIGQDNLEGGDDPSWYVANESGIELEHFVSKNLFVSVSGKLRNTFTKIGIRNQQNQFRWGYSFGIKVGGYLGSFRN